ncbi:MAG: adenylate/guanylate cyclase domain-containing protein [gamma proteobacterium symbiont of Taylorina sp.]|nr:adenylate/guanylate cyclase domain-containing protein [gamma proteobacterium symbiont of Taylorina sp.]
MKSKDQKQILISALSSLAVLLIFIFLVQTSFWKNIENWGFDWLSVLNQPPLTETEILIVNIDEPSFQEIGLQWPWPRAIHAQLVDNLTQAGASAIVFDIVFAEPSIYGDEDDMSFAVAIQKSKRVILASDSLWQDTAHGLIHSQVEPLEIFLSHGAMSGLVHVQPDSDGTLRALPNGNGLLWKTISQFLQHKGNHAYLPKNLPENGLIHFIGPADTFPAVHYYQALDLSLLPKDIFKDRIILIGLNLRAAPEIGAGTTDRFKTPYYRLDTHDTAGVEIHANILENIKHKLIIQPFSSVFHIILLILATFISTLFFSRWTIKRSSIYLILMVLTLLALSWFVFTILKIWITIISSLLLIILIYNINALFAYLRERKQKIFFHNAFSRYVSSHILNDILENPDKLKLGGEHRIVTLMFTDIAGFTTISEQLSAEQTAQLLNRYLSRMSKIITEHGGTLDKYIGDAIMAFWGAPIDDPQHPYHACLAALEMQKEAEKIRLQFLQEGLPDVRMRIGIHTGEAILGNMGSDELFDYSAIGDNVNLAARLEGVNKIYHTWIMISGITAGHIKDQFHLQSVDRVRVKGKNTATEIFTFVKNNTIAELSDQATQYYLKQQWDLAEQCWNEVLQQDPDNTIAVLYLKRIDEFKKNPPLDGWQGITALTSK